MNASENIGTAEQVRSEKSEAWADKKQVPFHVGLVAELIKEKIKVELIVLMLGFIAMAGIVSSIATSWNGVQVVSIDKVGKLDKIEKLGEYEYWDSHIQSVALDFLTFYFDKDPLSAKAFAQKALLMMTTELAEKEFDKATVEINQVIDQNQRVLNAVRSLEIDGQDRFTVLVIAERTNQSLNSGRLVEKKELVRYAIYLAPERRSVDNGFKGLRIKGYKVEVL